MYYYVSSHLEADWDLVRPSYLVSEVQRCGTVAERDGPDGPPDFEDTLESRGRCCHGDHQRYVSKAENPLRYPFSVRIQFPTLDTLT